MLRSCKWCGRVHDSKYDCGKRPQYKRIEDAAHFRSSPAWHHKRTEIKERDLYLCRMCLLDKKLTCDDLSVHHIEPLSEAWGMRLDNDNLITLCGYHHEQAECGNIARNVLHEAIKVSPHP